MLIEYSLFSSLSWFSFVSFGQPENGAFLQYLTNVAPSFIGGWCLIGIFAASMSTADGAILAMGTVLSNNILRHFKSHCVTHDNLLKAARYATIPFGVLAAVIASTRPNQTGYLLIVAFDITLATAVVPLFGCFYAKKPRPAAAFASVVTGVTLRIILEFTLPKARLRIWHCFTSVRLALFRPEYFARKSLTYPLPLFPLSPFPIIGFVLAASIQR